jgi:hypothetical protein
MRSSLVLLFSLTAFLASFLLFWAEPMIGKMVLPLFGGTPAVWNTCLVYFQFVLLWGYAIGGVIGILRHDDHRMVRRTGLIALGPAIVLACLLPPIAPDPDVANRVQAPVFQLLRMLFASATFPLCVVAATAPLVQVWFSMTGHPRSHDPYFLYAASNAGSLLALLAYPFAVEPTVGLVEQARLWRAGFIVLAVMLAGCGLVAWTSGRRHHRETLDDEASDQGLPRRALTTTLPRWLALVFIPSSWLMGVTTYLTTDLAPMPLLWVIPLALYLLSFMIAFGGPDSAAVRLAARVLPSLVLALALVLSAGFVHAFWIPLHLLTFFAGSIACHAALARTRPRAGQLGPFYLAIALGGLLGGVFNAILAPVLFDRIVEYPLAIVLGAVFGARPDAPAKSARRHRLIRDLLLPAAVLVLTAVLVTNRAGLADSVAGVAGVMAASGLAFYALVTARRRPMRFALTTAAVLGGSGLTQGVSGRLLHIERDFFGVVRVTEDAERTVHRLFHGSTLHGQQSLDPILARGPSTYFTRTGPIGQVFEALGPRIDEVGTRIAVVGLGAGTLGAYARRSQHWTFYEIDPAIERIARDSRYFTYLRDSDAAELDVVLGDARLRLREVPDHAYRLIVLDAFSSDSLPVHLVTLEAIRLYRSKLADGGVLAFNLSNRYLDLDPLVGRQAEDAGLVARICYDTEVGADERRAGKQPSIWAVMAASEGDLGPLASDSRWRPPRIRPGSRAWTDDESDLVSYLRRGPVRPPADRSVVPRDRPTGDRHDVAQSSGG